MSGPTIDGVDADPDDPDDPKRIPHDAGPLLAQMAGLTFSPTDGPPFTHWSPSAWSDPDDDLDTPT